MNALPAVILQQSAFGTNELTTQLVLRLVDDDVLEAAAATPVDVKGTPPVEIEL